MKTFVIGALLCVSILGPVTAAGAKSLSRMIAETGLSPQDFELMNEAASKLVVNGTPVVGRQVSWSNPDSGSKGSVKLRAMRGNCGYITHSTFPQGGERSLEIRSRLCEDASGRWVLTP